MTGDIFDEIPDIRWSVSRVFLVSDQRSQEQNLRRNNRNEHLSLFCNQSLIYTQRNPIITFGTANLKFFHY